MTSKASQILFIDHAPVLGGAEHSLLLLMAHLDQTKWQPLLAGVEGKLTSQANTEGIETHLVRLPRLRRNRQTFANWKVGVEDIKSLAERKKVVALYANTVRAAFYAFPAAKLSRKPMIWHMRDFWLSEEQPSTPGLDTLLKKILCAMSARVVANSQAVALNLPCPQKTVVVHNGIDWTSFQNFIARQNYRQVYHISQNSIVVGMVGRLRPWKGQIRFLKIASRILNRYPDTHFLLVGGDPFQISDNYSFTLKELVEQLKLGKNVHFTGHLRDVRPALSAMDIFVHPGNPEPFGLVNIEAMAMRKPVVAFSHGALPEIVRHDYSGLLVSPYDELKMANAIISLLNNPSRRAEFGKNGSTIVQEHFTIQHTALGIETILDEVIR